MPVSDLTDQLLPYWQGAGYTHAWEEERPWLEQIAALIGPSLTRLEDAVAMTHYLFVPEVGYSEDAQKRLHQAGSAEVVAAISDVIPAASPLSEAIAQDLIKQVAQALNRKEGQLKPILRAALTGEMKGPDLIQSWLLLHQRGWDRSRLQAALAIAQAQ
jgi:glutamyl-tRNA synthetase